GETLYAVGDWGQSDAWKRGSGVRLAKSGNMYTGTAKVDKGHAMAFRLIKVDASGRTTWDPSTDRKSTADRTKSLGVAWNVSTVNEDGVPPVSLSITGAGVKDGELSLSAGSLAQLSVAGSSSKADMWWSDGAAVAVSGTGNVYAVQAGTAKVSAKVDGKTVSVTVTVK
ncbi:MAG: carbohydrate-binding module family 20 domain-containing protein, partial [Bifidobacterium adolescentis]